MITVAAIKAQYPHPMTTREFYTQLRRWLAADPNVRVSTHPYKVRFIVQGRQYCPITYLALKIADEHYDLNEYTMAASRLGIPVSLSSAMVNAADSQSTRSMRRTLKQIAKQRERMVVKPFLDLVRR